MFDPGIVKGLSDTELAQAVQGQGSAPGWLCLAELQKRNKLRSSAPVQAPQGTVAQSVVRQALGQAGVQMPAQASPTQPQSGIGAQSPMQQPQAGIAAQPQQSLAKGGIVQKFDDGGYYTPNFQQVTPQTVKPQFTYTPTATDIQSAQAQIAPMYGDQPNYQAMTNQLQAANTQAQAPMNSVGRTITNLIGNIAANPGNPYQGWGKGLLANQDQNDKLRQENFANSLKTVEGTSKITDDQQRRAQAMAATTASYAEHQQQLADSQAQMKMAADTHNAQMAQQATEANNRNSQAVAQDRIELAKNEGDPQTVLGMLSDAQKRGDQPAVQALSAHLAELNKQRQTQLQQASSIQEAARMREQAAEFANQRQLEGMREAAENKRAQLQYGTGPGSAQDAMTTAVDMVGRYQDDKGSVVSNRIPFGQRLQFEQMLHDKYPNYDAANFKTLQQASNDKSLPAANTAVMHMGMLRDYYNALDDAGGNQNNPTVNALAQKIGTAFGSDIATNPQGIRTNLAMELAQGYGTKNQQAEEALGKLFDPTASTQSRRGILNQQIRALGEKLESNRNSLTSGGVPEDNPVMNKIGLQGDAKAVAVATGLDPMRPSRGFAYEGLPGGNGKPATKDIAKQFYEASGHNAADAHRMMEEFGWRGYQ